jgi:hypothetical protein
MINIRKHTNCKQQVEKVRYKIELIKNILPKLKPQLT